VRHTNWSSGCRSQPGGWLGSYVSSWQIVL
jgi:hypothetical protein